MNFSRVQPQSVTAVKSADKKDISIKQPSLLINKSEEKKPQGSKPSMIKNNQDKTISEEKNEKKEFVPKQGKQVEKKQRKYGYNTKIQPKIEQVKESDYLLPEA